MNSSNTMDAIGGYFELELNERYHPGSNTILLNSGRSCLEYVLKASGARRVYLPKFTCDVMLEPLRRLEIPYEFYSIDDRLELAESINVAKDEMLVYTNYFGLKDEYSRKLAHQYGSRLIIDCSQAFYFDPPAGSHTLYSPRKFFGLPDGGILATNLRLSEDLPFDQSYGRTSHLLKRIDLGAEAGYADFKHNDADLTGQPLSRMSRLTERLLGSVDVAAAQAKRQENFKYLREHLGASNPFHIAAPPTGPMVYPYLTTDAGLRDHLIQHRVFVATYWPNVLEWCKPTELEYQLTTELLPLPIDQRYGKQQMEILVRLIHERTN